MNRSKYQSSSVGEQNSRRRNSSYRENNDHRLKGGPNFRGDSQIYNERRISRNVAKPAISSDFRERLSGRLSSRLEYQHDLTNDDSSFHESPFGWYKITVYNVGHYELDTLLESLEKILQLRQFNPIESHFSRNNLCFFTKNTELAKKFFDNNKKYNLSSDSMLSFSVKTSKEPRFSKNETDHKPSKIMMLAKFDVDDDVDKKSEVLLAKRFPKSLPNNRSILMDILNKRYNSNNFHLDISNFSKDDEFQRNNIKYQVYSREFSDVLNDFCTNISALDKIISIDLSHNRLFRVDILIRNSQHFEKLQSIIFKNNSIDRLEEVLKLKCFQNLSVLDLSLNPIEQELSETSIKTIRKNIPSLKILNDQQLPPLISFDLDISTNLPNVLPDFSPVESSIKEQISSFINKYFQVFEDANNRDLLLDAYDDNAIFSIAVSNVANEKYTSQGIFCQMSHNLLSQDARTKSSLVMQNRLKIVGFLKDFPSIKTDLQNTHFDIPLFVPSVVIVIVRGLMAEIKGVSSALNYWQFYRSFIIKVYAGRLLIINDQLSLKMANTDILSLIDSSKNIADSNYQMDISSSSCSVDGSSNSNKNAILKNLSQEKAQILKQFSDSTGMNYEWSLLCLNQYQWDFNLSVLAFRNLSIQNAIPLEAFKI